MAIPKKTNAPIIETKKGQNPKVADEHPNIDLDHLEDCMNEYGVNKRVALGLLVDVSEVPLNDVKSDQKKGNGAPQKTSGKQVHKPMREGRKTNPDRTIGTIKPKGK